MTKNEILDYIMSTPENTNRQVLQYLLDDISSGGNIPLPEYECDFVGAIGGGITINLDLDDITEDDVLVTVHFEEEGENSNLYLILDLNTGTGIAMEADDIVGFITDFDTMENNNTYCIMAAWPPQSQPQPTESYKTWQITSDTLNYSLNQEETYYITDATYPGPVYSEGEYDLLSYIQIEPTDNDNYNMYTKITGVIIDGTFLDINSFYANWNSDIIAKTQSYQYAFTFKDTPVSNSGQCTVSWYGAELKGEK